MADIELLEVEDQPGHRLLFHVRVNAAAGRMEFPIGVTDEGSAPLNETAVLRSTLAFAEDLATSTRTKLGASGGAK